jgi:TolB protein
MKSYLRFIALCVLLLSLRWPEAVAQESIGVFSTNSDVGTPQHAGSVQYDAANKTYTVTGGGANMWATNDAFQFVWKKVSGDVSLATNIKIIGTEGDAHRKACLMIRQSLDADSAYADAALHGNGLAALQYREAKGAITKDAKLKADEIVRLQIEKRGDDITVSIPKLGEKVPLTKESIQMHFNSPFYVGLAVCSHDDKTVRQAEFVNAQLKEEK